MSNRERISGRIFISYRRQDSAYPAGWLYDRLAGRFGDHQIFKDVDSIGIGQDFVDVISEAVASCEVLLAVIGSGWLNSTDADGRRRLDNPDDFVRVEIETALSRDVLVIPILVEGAAMPRAVELPPGLASLVRRQALELSPSRFHADTSRLLDVVERTMNQLHDDRRRDPVRPAEDPETALPGGPSSPGSGRLAPVAPESEGTDAALDDAGKPGEKPARSQEERHRPSAPPTTASSGLPAAAAPTNAVGGTPGPGGSGAFRRRRHAIAMAVAAASLVVMTVVAAAVVPHLRPTSREGPAGGGVRTTGSGRSTTGPTPTPAPIGGPDGPLVLAHRGGDETFAWQTLPAFVDAARAGAAVETDVRWTSDGVPILVHEPGTTPGMECEGGNYVVAETSWPVLRDRCRSSKAASTDRKRYRIPTFAEAVSAVAAVPAAQIFAEVKVEQTATEVRQFLAILENVHMVDRAVVTSFFPGELANVRDQARKDGVVVRTMLFVSRDRIAAADLGSRHLWGVAVESGLADDRYLTALHREGLQVGLWLANTVTLWRYADRSQVDFVLTDRPKAYGRWTHSR